MNIDYSKKYPQVKKVPVSTMFEYKDKVAYSVDAFGNVPESVIQELKDNHPLMVYEQTKCGQDHYRDIVFFDSREDVMLYLYEESEAASNQAYEVYNIIGEGSATPFDGKDCLGMNYDRLMNGVVPARSEGVETTYQIRDCKTGEVISHPTWTDVNTEAFLLIDAVFDERAKKTLAKRVEFNKTADALRENTRKLYDLPEGTYAKVKAVNYRCDNFEPYYTGYVAVNRFPVDDDGYWSLRVLNVESVNKDNNTFGGRDPVEGDYLSVYSSDLFVEEIIGKDPQAAEIINVIRGEMQVADIINDLLQSAADGIAAVAGICTVECVEDDDLVGGIFEITLHHGQLIEVGHDREVTIFNSIHGCVYTPLWIPGMSAAAQSKRV